MKFWLDLKAHMLALAVVAVVGGLVALLWWFPLGILVIVALVAYLAIYGTFKVDIDLAEKLHKYPPPWPTRDPGSDA